MEEKNVNGLREQQARRKRINRLKSSIVAVFVIWIIILTALLVILLVKVTLLEQRLDNELVSKEEITLEHDEKGAESPKEKQ